MKKLIITLLLLAPMYQSVAMEYEHMSEAAKQAVENDRTIEAISDEAIQLYAEQRLDHEYAQYLIKRLNTIAADALSDDTKKHISQVIENIKQMID